MKYLILIISITLSIKAQAQESKQFTIEGQVKKTKVFDLQSLNNYKIVELDSMVVNNHLLQRKGSLENIRGILLKDILSEIEITSESPKNLSEYYFVCTATDNYKVVFSWNEIFNTETGKQVLVLISFKTNPAKGDNGNIALISPKDEATGRRYVKGLSKISILRAN